MDPSSSEALNSLIAKDILDEANKYKQCDFASVQTGNLKSHSDENKCNKCEYTSPWLVLKMSKPHEPRPRTALEV